MRFNKIANYKVCDQQITIVTEPNLIIFTKFGHVPGRPRMMSIAIYSTCKPSNIIKVISMEKT